MSELVIAKSRLGGSISAPPSKSYTHRALIAALLTDGKCKIEHPLWCNDTMATLGACRALGATVRVSADEWVVRGTTHLSSSGVIRCGESASTMRFLTPVVALAPGTTRLVAKGTLRSRPMQPLIHTLSQLGVSCHIEKDTLSVVGGGIRGGRASLTANASSQFLTGLLFACPLAQTDSQLWLTSPPVSKPYVSLTVDILRKAGIQIAITGDMRTYRIPAGQVYRPIDHHIPGDWSSTALLLAAAVITRSTVTIEKIKFASLQGDKEIVNMLRLGGIEVQVEEMSVTVKAGQLRGFNVDVTHTPDLFPVYTVLGCYAEGMTKISGAARLRLKESDRLAVLSGELRKMGARIRELKDGLLIKGGYPLHGAHIDPHSDHRVAMACAVAALGADEVTRIQNAECIDKSYPCFVRDLQALGATIWADCVR